MMPAAQPKEKYIIERKNTSLVTSDFISDEAFLKVRI